MPDEAAYKRRLVAEVNLLPGGYARRIEDRFAVGVLDLIIKFPDLPIVFAEGKMIVGGYLFGPTARQFAEGNKIEAAGLRAVLIGWKAGRMSVSPWREKADARESFTMPDLGDADALHKFLKDT
jgi:hypothetical protein